MGLFNRNKDMDEESSAYYKCNGDIEVHVYDDGTEIYSVPSDYKSISTEEGDCVFCPQCDSESIYYHNGEYICTDCECTFSEQELIDFCGCGIIHI